jgi:hypothetical protein
LLAETEHDLQTILEVVNKEGEELGMKMNVRKTKASQIMKM